jgi:hypothetical protein
VIVAERLDFKRSAPLTMGVELELQIIDRRTGDLTRGASDLIHLVERKPFPGDIKPEITESMVEISTAVHAEFDALRAQLRAMRDALVAASTCASPVAARTRSSAGTSARSSTARASATWPGCTGIWPSSSRCSASTCTSAAPTAARRCACCTRWPAMCRNSSRWPPAVRITRARTRRSTARD